MEFKVSDTKKKANKIVTTNMDLLGKKLIIYLCRYVNTICINIWISSDNGSLFSRYKANTTTKQIHCGLIMIGRRYPSLNKCSTDSPPPNINKSKQYLFFCIIGLMLLLLYAFAI